MSRKKGKVYCSDGSECGGKEFAYENQVEPSMPFVCLKCQKAKYGVDIMDFLLTKIGHTKKAPRDAYRFAIRELVQNADDAGASVVTIRIDRDALYVANDGYPFRPPNREKGWDGDFIRICRVLSRPKAKDAETTGAHGSGFQTVYCFTNHPEIHSSGNSARMDPTTVDENKRIMKLEASNEPKRRSPYHPVGVLFRFPWRTEKEAHREYERRKFFEAPEWQRWDDAQRRLLFESLCSYVHDLILCTQRLKTIRIMRGGSMKAYQVLRTDFHLEDVQDKSYVGRIEEGFIEVSDDWEGSFSSTEWKWKKMTCPEDGWVYLIGSEYVHDSEGARVYFGENLDGEAVLTTELSDVEADERVPKKLRILQKSNVHLLLPMYDMSAEEREKPSFFRYSVLPIPYRLRNRFACSAHVVVDEDRSSLKLGDEMHAEWFDMVMATLKDLYLRVMKEYLGKIRRLGMPPEGKQSLIMNSIPANALHDWIDPKGEMDEELKDEFDELLSNLVELPILCSGDRMICPHDAYWVEDAGDRKLIARLGEEVLSDDFINHPHFTMIEEHLGDCKFREEDFLKIWEGFEVSNRSKGVLNYNQALVDGGRLDETLLTDLIGYSLGSSIPEIRALPVIPDMKGILRDISNFPSVSDRFKCLLPLLRDENRINDDFAEVVHSLLHEDSGPNDIIRFLSEAVHSQEKRLTKLNRSDHGLVTEVVSRAVADQRFALEDVKDCTFIPYTYQDTVCLGEPNKDEHGNLLEWSVHTGEYYSRNHIFKEQRKDVPGLTPEMQRGIRIASLPGLPEKRREEIGKKLRLVALFEKASPVPTNFVRVYVSPKGGSLFEDQVLEDFLTSQSSIPPSRVTSKMIDEQKRSLLDAVKAYFLTPAKGTETGLTGDDMKDVPCFYDPKGVWHNAGEFAIDVDEELEIMQKHPLHRDFSDAEWPGETLVKRLGVCKTPDLGDVVGAILRLTEDETEENREGLKALTYYLLTSNLDLVDSHGVSLNGRPEMKNLEWLPVRGGLLNRTCSCLLPTDKNIMVMGPDYEEFVDISFEGMDSTALDQAERRSRDIGIKARPQIDEMLALVKELYESEENPPPGLFDELSSKDRVYPESIYQDKVYANAYFDHKGGLWWSSKDIRLMDDSQVPHQLRSRFLFVHPNSLHSGYLRYFLGVRESLSDEDILRYLSSTDPEIDLTLWQFLSSAPRSNRPLADEFGELPIFPVPEDPTMLLKPLWTILKDDVVFTQSGTWGDWYVLDREDSRITQDMEIKLMQLGATYVDDLDTDNLIEILKSMRWKGHMDDSLKYDNMLSLLVEIGNRSESGEHIKLKEPCVPVRLSGGFIVKRISDCYLADTYEASLFRGKIPVLDWTIHGDVKAGLKYLFDDNGAKSLDEYLDRTPRRRPKRGQSDESQTIRFRELRKALMAHFERNVHDDEAKASLGRSLDWVQDCQVLRYDDITVEYKIGHESAAAYGYDVEKADDIYIINIARIGTSKTMLKLANQIYKICEGVEPSDELRKRESELKFMVTDLLSSELDEWELKLSGSGYRFDGPELPPPLMEMVEITTKGYSDTRERLRNWYQACQVCMTRTPSDDSGYESCENVTSVIVTRGSRYQGEFKEYSPENCLFLCPTHQVLFKRGLIRIPYLELALKRDVDSAKEKVEERKARIKRGIKNRDMEAHTITKDIWTVFETPVDEFSTDESQWRWEDNEIHFRVEHLLGLLGRVSEYLVRRENDEG